MIDGDWSCYTKLLDGGVYECYKKITLNTSTQLVLIPTLGSVRIRMVTFLYRESLTFSLQCRCFHAYMLSYMFVRVFFRFQAAIFVLLLTVTLSSLLKNQVVLFES